MRYNFVTDSFHTKQFCSKQTFFKRSAILDGEIGRFAFFESLFGRLRSKVGSLAHFY